MLEPEKYKADQAIITETALQLIKDFDSAGIQLTFSGNVFSAYDELLNQLIPIMADLHKNDRHLFKQLLYRIDIPESRFKKLLLEDNSQFIFSLSDAILKREFQKVLTRHYFKK